MELSPVQRRIRDFYFKEALSAPAATRHVHRAGLVPEQRLFRIEDLRRHLNNPLLDLNYLTLFHAGKAVDLTAARLYKLVQRRKIEFVDHRVLQQHFAQGAACVLEGLDILEPEINALAAALDRAHTATFCNATAFSPSAATKPTAGTSIPTMCWSSTSPAKNAGNSIARKHRGGSA